MKQKQNNTEPVQNKKDVQQSNDKHIDEDFENYPHSPASARQINPKTKEDKITSKGEPAKDTAHAEGKNESNRKIIKPHDEEETAHTGSTGKSFATTDFPGNEDIDELNSDGSAGAFNATEGFSDEDDISHLDEK
jgi:hypothetical protein